MTRAELGWALLPGLFIFIGGVGLFLGIAWWLRLRYGPDAITQWTGNAPQIEFWGCDVPLYGWLGVWGLSLVVSIRRCRTNAGRRVAVVMGLAALVVGLLSVTAIMDGPFP